jgi:hypothetical protein
MKSILMKDTDSNARFSSEIIPESSTSEEYFEKPHENIFEDVCEKDDNEAPTRTKRQRTTKTCGDDFIVYLVDDTPRPLLRHMHHQMQIIERSCL